MLVDSIFLLEGLSFQNFVQIEETLPQGWPSFKCRQVHGHVFFQTEGSTLYLGDSSAGTDKLFTVDWSPFRLFLVQWWYPAYTYIFPCSPELILWMRGQVCVFAPPLTAMNVEWSKACFFPLEWHNNALK
jgi:hypothetical protein